MKLDRGQGNVPVPCPIQSRPTASANRPAICRNLRICLPVGICFCRSTTRSSVLRRPDGEKLQRQTIRSLDPDTMAPPAEGLRKRQGEYGAADLLNKKAPDDAGASDV